MECALRVIGALLDPDRVSHLLNTRPTEAHRQGDRLQGQRAENVWKDGVWVLRSPLPRDCPLNEHVRHLLGVLDPTRAGVGQLVDEGHRVEVFAGVFLSGSNEGIELAPEQMALLGALGVHLSLDVYA